MRNSHWETIKSYSSLGYDISLTTLYGKDAIRMVKRHSHKRGSSIVCTQVSEHDKLDDLERFNDTVDWMYNDIQNQEETEEYQSE